MKFTIFDRFVTDDHQRRNNQDLLDAANTLGQLLYFGTTVPTFHPTDTKGNRVPALYLKAGGTTTTTLYVFNTTTSVWTAK